MNDLKTKPEAEASHLPANIEAEQALLGCILYDNSAYERVDDGLRAEHFFEPFHQRLFASIETAVRAGQLAEPITLMDRFQGDKAFEELGGVAYLADLVDRAPPAVNAVDYARIVRDLALRRSMIGTFSDVGTLLREDTETPAIEHLELAEQELFRLAESKASGGVVSFGEALAGAISMAAEAHGRDGGLAGLSTGLIDLDQKLGGLHRSDLVILAARPSMGKAQPLDAKVLLRNGVWARMGDLRLGDELASVDGAPSRVAGIFPRGERQTYRVTFSDGRSAVVCGEHLWTIRCCKFPERERVVSTDSLREMLKSERFQRRMSVPLVSGHFGNDRGLMIEPWFLGALIGNGSMTNGRLSISTADAATLYRVQRVVGHDCVIPTGDAGYDYRLNDGALKAALRHYGLYGSGSPAKFIPPAYLSASREARMELLRGLLDTDGWVEEFGAVRYCTTSPRLADDVKTLVRSIGGVCTVSTKRPHFTHGGERREGLTAYVLNISHPDRASLVSLKRKQRRCEKPMRFRAPTVVSVEPESIEPVQCIRVTHPSQLYVTDDYVVTHNTSLAVNIAHHAAKAYRYEAQPDGTHKTVSGGKVLFFSLEMSADQLALRAVCAEAGVSGDKARKGELSPAEFGRVRDAAIELNEIPLYIDATGGLALPKLFARARRQKRLTGLDLIVVDYLQLVTLGGRVESRVQEVSQITQGLKALAKELDVPVLALSQLSRAVEQREDKKPQLSDLRDSGSIEQDADMVIFLYREEYYLSRLEPRAGTEEHLKWMASMEECRGLAEAIVGKQRHGPIGTVRLTFNEELTKFGNLARDSHFAGRNPYGGGE